MTRSRHSLLRRSSVAPAWWASSHQRRNHTPVGSGAAGAGRPLTAGGPPHVLPRFHGCQSAQR
jgi:hypothetical protein